MPRTSNVELRKLNLNLPVSLVDRIDEYAKTVGVNRSSAIIFLITSRLEEWEKVNVSSVMNENVKNILGNSELMEKVLGKNGSESIVLPFTSDT